MGTRTRWLIPVLLAVLIVIIVLGALFGTKIKNAIAGPSPTPTFTPTPKATSTPAKTVVVVTATPANGATATAQATAAAAQATVLVATASPQGGSTPLPGGTPVPTVQGLTLGMITHPQHVVQTLQSQADAGNPTYQYFLNPYLVVQRNLPQYGFKGGFSITSPTSASTVPTPATQPGGRPIESVTVSYQGKVYVIRLAQVIKAGPKGIWSIVTILSQAQA